MEALVKTKYGRRESQVQCVPYVHVAQWHGLSPRRTYHTRFLYSGYDGIYRSNIHSLFPVRRFFRKTTRRVPDAGFCNFSMRPFFNALRRSKTERDGIKILIGSYFFFSYIHIRLMLFLVCIFIVMNKINVERKTF